MLSLQLTLFCIWDYVNTNVMLSESLRTSIKGNVQRSVTHDSLRYINILSYLLTYLLTETICDVRPSVISTNNREIKLRAF